MIIYINKCFRNIKKNDWPFSLYPLLNRSIYSQSDCLGLIIQFVTVLEVSSVLNKGLLKRVDV